MVYAPRQDELLCMVCVLVDTNHGHGMQLSAMRFGSICLLFSILCPSLMLGRCLVGIIVFLKEGLCVRSLSSAAINTQMKNPV